MIAKDGVAVTTGLIRRLLEQHDRAHALSLFDAIVERAATDAAFARHLDAWLEDSGTVLLRDKLCRPFQTAAFITTQPDRRYPWEDAWMAIDSARLHARFLPAAQPQALDSSV